MQKWLSLAAASTIASGATGYFLYNREKEAMLQETLDELEKERKNAAAQCFSLEGEIRKLKEIESNQQIALQDKMSTVKSLWDERDRRIASETKRSADAIYATPEAYTVMTGITAHCNDSSNKFPFFYEEFDLNASKVHTIDMLANIVNDDVNSSVSKNNNNNNKKWLFDISPALGMFRSDPFISAMNLLLRADMKLHNYPEKRLENNTNNNNNKETDSHQLPQSVTELSKTFGRMMNHFQVVCCNSFQNQKQIERASEMRQQAQLDQQQLRTVNNTSNDQQQQQVAMLPPPELGFFIERVVPRVADATHLVTTAEADYLELQEQRELQRRKDIASSWQLLDQQDIFAAISYVTKTHDKVVTAAANGESWALDSRVAPAMKNLLVWSVAAEQYLAEMQSREVLRNMTRCMSHSFVAINDLPAGYDGK
jgi:hypothetical protein